MLSTNSGIVEKLTSYVTQGSMLLTRSKIVFDACKDSPPTSFGVINAKRMQDDFEEFSREVKKLTEAMNANETGDSVLALKAVLARNKLRILQDDLNINLVKLNELTKPREERNFINVKV